jgi:putative endonuclease
VPPAPAQLSAGRLFRVTRRGLGAFGEAWAIGYLGRRGWTIVDRNVRFRSGEIDIVADDGKELVFVEVKCRRSHRFGTPEESINATRYRHLALAVAEYLQRQGLEERAHRVDVIALEMGTDGRVRAHRHLRGVEAPA